jgi:hypothetical protein
MGYIRQVQQDSLGARNQLADLEVEAIVHTRHQPAAAPYLGGVAGSVNGNCQEACDCLVRHQNTPSGTVEIAVARLYTLRPRMEQRIGVAMPVMQSPQTPPQKMGRRSSSVLYSVASLLL